MPDKERAIKRRADMACTICRERKLRCENKNSEPPCERCKNHDPLKCVFKPVSKDTRYSSTPTGEEYSGGGAPQSHSSPMLSTTQRPFYNGSAPPIQVPAGYAHPPSLPSRHIFPMTCPQTEQTQRTRPIEQQFTHDVHNYSMAVEPNIVPYNPYPYSPVPCSPFISGPTIQPRSQPVIYGYSYPPGPSSHEGFQQNNQHASDMINYPSNSSGVQGSYNEHRSSPYHDQQPYW